MSKDIASASDEGPFRPHTFAPLVQILQPKVPRVLMSVKAYLQMCVYVEIASREVGWLGTIEQTDSGDFFIGETFLLEQEVYPDQTELSLDGLAALMGELSELGDEGLAEMNQLKFWGHSHVRYTSDPSRADDRTMSDDPFS